MNLPRRGFLSGTVAATGAALGITQIGAGAGVRAAHAHLDARGEATDRHRRGFDEDPVTYLHENIEHAERELRESAAAYLGAQPDEVAITGNTTTGLALLYGGLP